MLPEIDSKWRAYGGTRSLWQYVGPGTPSDDEEPRFRIRCIEPREGSSYVMGSELDVPLHWFAMAAREE